MRYILLVLILTCLFFTTGCLVSTDEEEATGVGFVYGVVTGDSLGSGSLAPLKAPYSSSAVSLINLQSFYSAMTDVSGNFLFRMVPSGNYVLVVDGTDQDLICPVRVNGQEITALHVHADRSREKEKQLTVTCARGSHGLDTGSITEKTMQNPSTISDVYKISPHSTTDSDLVFNPQYELPQSTQISGLSAQSLGNFFDNLRSHLPEEATSSYSGTRDISGMLDNLANSQYMLPYVSIEGIYTTVDQSVNFRQGDGLTVDFTTYTDAPGRSISRILIRMADLVSGQVVKGSYTMSGLQASGSGDNRYTVNFASSMSTGIYSLSITAVDDSADMNSATAAWSFSVEPDSPAKTFLTAMINPGNLLAQAEINTGSILSEQEAPRIMSITDSGGGSIEAGDHVRAIIEFAGKETTIDFASPLTVLNEEQFNLFVSAKYFVGQNYYFNSSTQDFQYSGTLETSSLIALRALEGTDKTEQSVAFEVGDTVSVILYPLDTDKVDGGLKVTLGQQESLDIIEVVNESSHDWSDASGYTILSGNRTPFGQTTGSNPYTLTVKIGTASGRVETLTREISIESSPPLIHSVSATQSEIVVIFDQAIEQSADLSQKFSINGITVIDAELSAPDTVLLSINGAIQGAEYTLIVRNISDTKGNQTQAAYKTFEVL